MNIIQKQILLGIFYSLLLTSVSLLLFLYVFPLESLSILLEKELMGLPFILFVPVFSIFVGTIMGGSTGYYWQKQLQDIGEELSNMELGKIINLKEKKTSSDVAEIYSKLNKLRVHVSEQITVSQKMANERSEEQNKQIQKIVSQERNRLARELHDSVSQQLFAASMLMSAINENPIQNEQQAKQLKLVEGMIHQSQLEMRALLLHLRPVPLKGKSLKEGIEELLIELMQQVPMKIVMKLEDIKIDKGVEDQLFRILQESISNTLRHSKANIVEVYLVKREGMIILIVLDDGVGFDVEASKVGSYGLQNMHERALEVGGMLKIVSVINKGTRLEVKVPVIEKDEIHEY